ncbi:MAG: type II toxin-antitoxin system MqsA family antitoxin [Cyclonatronaceae bacterium]
MKCTVCKNGIMEHGKVNVTLQRDNTVVIIKDLLAKVCSNCDEYIFSSAVSKNVINQAEKAATSNAEVEILHYAT